MAATRTRKLPNCYFVGPEGRIATVPEVDAELLRSSLVRQLLGLRPPVAADIRST
jgi:hypothetical protein